MLHPEEINVKTLIWKNVSINDNNQINEIINQKAQEKSNKTINHWYIYKIIKFNSINHELGIKDNNTKKYLISDITKFFEK